MSVCVISFSARKNGNCAKISDFVCSLLSDVKQYQFSDFHIHPCGSCDYQCFRSGGQCPWIADKEYELLDSITQSELTYFILPNYCDYPCANFFVFSERQQSYFYKRRELSEAYEKVPKRAIVVSNTNEENFRSVLALHSCRQPEILFLHAARYGRSSVKGDLLTSEEAADDVKKFVLY